MVDPVPVSPLPSSPTFPVVARFGLIVMAFGLLLDFVEHDLVSHLNEPTIVGFPLSEHAAHFVVLVGMVLVLVGIVRDGVRINRRRTQKNRSSGHALR